MSFFPWYYCTVVQQNEKSKYSNSKMIELEVQKYESSDQEKKSTKTIFFNKNNVIKTLLIK